MAAMGIAKAFDSWLDEAFDGPPAAKSPKAGPATKRGGKSPRGLGIATGGYARKKPTHDVSSPSARAARASAARMRRGAATSQSSPALPSMGEWKRKRKAEKERRRKERQARLATEPAGPAVVDEPEGAAGELCYSCDFGCGFEGRFSAVSAHEEACPNNPDAKPAPKDVERVSVRQRIQIAAQEADAVRAAKERAARRQPIAKLSVRRAAAAGARRRGVEGWGVGAWGAGA